MVRWPLFFRRKLKLIFAEEKVVTWLKFGKPSYSATTKYISLHYFKRLYLVPAVFINHRRRLSAMTDSRRSTSEIRRPGRKRGKGSGGRYHHVSGRSPSSTRNSVPAETPPSTPGSSNIHITTSLERSQPVTTSVQPTPRSGDESYPEVDRQTEL